MTWHGWVSAAVYLPSDPQGYTTHLHVAVAKLDRLHADSEQGEQPLHPQLRIDNVDVATPRVDKCAVPDVVSGCICQPSCM